MIWIVRVIKFLPNQKKEFFHQKVHGIPSQVSLTKTLIKLVENTQMKQILLLSKMKKCLSMRSWRNPRKKKTKFQIWLLCWKEYSRQMILILTMQKIIGNTN